MNKVPENDCCLIVDFEGCDEEGKKIYIYCKTPDDINFLQLNLPNALYLYMAREGNFAQVMHKEATKAKAVTALAQHWNIAHENIIAFGDDVNDIEMLQYAGMGVAMGNALDVVKAASDFVCADNNADGLAKWLNDVLARDEIIFSL